MFDCTIIIPTHNRHKYLYRSIDYFSRFNCKIIYVDSTDKAFDGNIGGNVKYFHLPGKKIYEKALFAIKQVDSENVAFCADDDFILDSTLEKGVDILNSDNKSTAVVGKYLGFYENFNDEFFEIKKKKLSYKVSNNKKENIKNYLSNYHQILWALYKKDTIKSAYEVISKAQFINDNFIEIVIATICSATGGIDFINDYWGVREISSSDSWGRRHRPLFDIIDTRDFQIDKDKFIEKISDYVDVNDAELALDSYLCAKRKKVNKKSIILKVRYSLRKILKNVFFKDIKTKDPRLDPIRIVLNKKY